MHDKAFPCEWKQRKLTDLAHYINGLAFKPTDWSLEGTQIIRIEQINNPDGYYDHFEGWFPEANAIDDGDLIFSWSATLKVVIWRHGKGVLNQHLFKVVPKMGFDKRFIFFLLDFHMPALGGGSHGSTMKHIKRGELERYTVQTPPLVEQQGIAEILSTIDEAIEQTEALITKTQKIKAGLMHDLFTRGVAPDGQLRPSREEAPKLYKESPLGWIPKEWDHATLNVLVSPNRPIVYGILMPGQGFPGGIPVVKVKDIVGGEIKTDDLLLTSPEIDAEYQRSKLKVGDILLTIRGTVGRLAMVPPHLDDTNITQDTARIGIVGGETSFYRYYLETHIPQRHFAINTLGVAVQGINLRDVRMTPAPMLERAEQAVIAKVLDETVRSLRTREEHLAKLRQIKAGLMHDLLTGCVRVPAADVVESKEAAVNA